MRHIARRNKNPYNSSRIIKRYNRMNLRLSRDTAQDVSICLKGCGTCVCNPIPQPWAWNTTLSSYWFTWAAQRFMSEHLSPPLRHHSQSGDIWHALAISMDLNLTGFQLTWRNPILYGAPHCITLHTRSHQIPLHWELSQDTWETSIAFHVW